MKRLLVAVALVAAALPVSAGAESPRPAGGRAEWARQYRANARNLPVASLLAAAEAAAATSADDYALLAPAGDLDGDGAGDVADLRVRQTYDDATELTTTSIRVEARRGRDGKLLWTRTVGGAAEYPYVFFAPVGANGRQGMVTVAKTAEVVDADEALAAAGTARVAAFDGAGKPLWTYDARIAAATSLAGGAATDVFADAVGDLVAGRAVDMLLESHTFAGAGDPVGVVDETASLVQLQALDGATGKVRDLGQPYAVTGPPPWPAVVGDVNGDKLDDVAYVDTAGAPTLRLVRSSDGGRHAAVTGIPAAEYFGVRRALDVTGDRVADVLVMSYAERSTTALVDAGRARVAWSRGGTAAYVVGDADRRAGSEIVMNEALDVPGGMGFRLTAVNGTGRVVWTATRTLKSTGGATLGNMAVSAGDAQGDGVTDFRYSMSLGSGARREDGFVEGRTGRVRTGLPADMLPAGAAFDGRGEDAFTRAYRSGALTLTAWRGDGSARLWQASMPASGVGAVTFGAALDRDRCADMAVTVGGSRTTTYVLSGATGASMWALTRSGDAAGVVSRPRLATRRFVRTC